MISDILSDAVAGLDHYLTEPEFKIVYKGKLRKEIVQLRNKMEEMRHRLDGPFSSGVHQIKKSK